MAVPACATAAPPIFKKSRRFNRLPPRPDLKKSSHAERWRASRAARQTFAWGHKLLTRSLRLSNESLRHSGTLKARAVAFSLLPWEGSAHEASASQLGSVRHHGAVFGAVCLPADGGLRLEQ